jgi:DNA-binding NarL/FixJ family response regulator
MHSAKILLIDDHAMFRTGMRMVLEAGFPQAAVIEAGSLIQALQNTDRAPDLVLLDIRMPGLNGVDGIPILKQKWPNVPILMLSSESEPENIRSAIARGASGFVSKAQTAEEIMDAARKILSGEISASPLTDSSEKNEPLTHLTLRQSEVLELLCQGLSNKLIARRLSLSENTVRGHVQAILSFLEVTSRSEAAFVARSRGLIG